MFGSIIIPSLNQGKYILNTLQSLRRQTYRNFEAMLIDGGSEDETLTIASSFTDVLSYIISEPDSGQSQAVNKGFRKARGDFIAWLNSDDYYLPYTLHLVATLFKADPNLDAVIGDCLLVDPQLTPLSIGRGEWKGLERFLMYWKPYTMHQPSVFLKRALLDKVGYLREDLHLIMDYDYWFRIGLISNIKSTGVLLSCSIRHGMNKTDSDFSNYHRHIRAAWKDYLQQVPPFQRFKLLFRESLYRFKNRLI